MRRLRLHRQGRHPGQMPGLWSGRTSLQSRRQEHLRSGGQGRRRGRNRSGLRRRADAMDEGRQGSHPRRSGRLPTPPREGQDRKDRPQARHDDDYAGICRPHDQGSGLGGLSADLRQQGRRNVSRSRSKTRSGEWNRDERDRQPRERRRKRDRSCGSLSLYLDAGGASAPRSCSRRIHARLHEGAHHQACGQDRDDPHYVGSRQ